MRTKSLLVLCATGVLLSASPALAGYQQPGFGPPPPVAFTISPVGGGPGTTIVVDGTCAGVKGSARLVELGSDTIAILDSKDFATDSRGHFRVDLTNPSGSIQGFPRDLIVDVYCIDANGNGSGFVQRPFHATSAGSTSFPTVFTEPGPGVCGYSFAPGFPPYACGAHVKSFDHNGRIGIANFVVAGFQKGAAIAVGDLNNDRALDIVTGSATGSTIMTSTANGGPNLGSYDHVYGDFDGGLSVAVGDVTGDGADDIVTGAGPGGGPHVKVFTFNTSSKAIEERGSFMAYAPSFSGGVNVAVGDVDGDGRAEIITGAGPGGGPHVRVFDDAGRVKNEFMAYADSFRGGVNVAAANLTGTPAAEVVTGAGAGGGPHVRVFTPAGAPLSGFYAYAPDFTGGVYVAAGRATGGSAGSVVTGPGPGGGPHVRVFDPTGSELGGFYAYTNVAAGVRVASLR